ncbi:MAG: hypothetical protein QOE64_1954 [Frankiales bacterium]|jgi:hypothetical protein|nr:hypothetical protein [Frankiales bacterium]
MDDYFKGTAGVTSSPGKAPEGGVPVSPAGQPWPQADQSSPPPVVPAQDWSGACSGHPAPRTSAGTKVLIGVACAVGGLVILGILAAVAIPVFLNQRAKAEAARTTVTLPEALVGYDRMHDVTATALEQQLLSPDTPGHGVAAVYGTNGHVAASVAIWTHPMTPRARDRFISDAERGAFESSHGELTSFIDVDPGPLGGRMRCAGLSNSVTLCMFVDSGAYGSIMVARPIDRGGSVAQSMRAEVEHRR